MKFGQLEMSLVIVTLLVGCESSPTAQHHPISPLASITSSGSVIEVSPTSTPADLEIVRAAIQAARPGDIVHLNAGTFDFSNAFAWGDQGIDNRICLKSHLTIEGEPGTVIQGPGRDYPPPGEGMSEAFTGGGSIMGVPCPIYNHVTIRELAFRDLSRGVDFALQETSDGHVIPIEGVRVTSNTFENMYLGIVAGGCLRGSVITGNTLKGVGTGIYVNAMWAQVHGPSDLLISKNDIAAENVGIQLVIHEPGNPSQLLGISILRNKLFGYSGGIRVSSGDPLIAENEIVAHEYGIAFQHWIDENPRSVANAIVRANRISLVEPVWPSSASIVLDHGAHDNLVVGNPILGVQGNLADILLTSSTHDNIVMAPSPRLVIVDNGTNNQVTGPN